MYTTLDSQVCRHTVVDHDVGLCSSHAFTCMSVDKAVDSSWYTGVNVLTLMSLYLSRSMHEFVA